MMKAYFPEQEEFLYYLETTYLSIAEQWATCYTNKKLNFGQRTTSPVESVNRYLKSFVVNGNSSVLQVVEQSLRMVQDMERNITAKTTE